MNRLFCFFSGKSLRKTGFLLLMLTLLTFCRGAVAQGKDASLRPSDSALLSRIAVLEEALFFRREGLRKEEERDIPGAMEAFAKSLALCPDTELERRMRSWRPDLQPLRDRIAFLESLLAAQKPGEEKISSLPPGLPALPEDSPGGRDTADWRTYPDLPAEKKAIEESLRGFRNALTAGDIAGASGFVDESCREVYAALFEQKPEAMPSFADLLEKANMSFMSAPENADPGTSSTLRTSEYAVDVGGFIFYVRWMKRDGKWVLFDF